MLKIGYKHTVDIKAFNEWQMRNNRPAYNNALSFFSDKVCENYRLIEVKNDFSNEFGERTYAFRSDEGKLRRLWFWTGSIQFFIPINDYVQEEMEL